MMPPTTWVSIACSISSGSWLPSWGLCSIRASPTPWNGIDFALPATFLTLLIPRLADRTALIVALVSALCAVLGALYLPGSWYIIIAAVAATLVGGLMERSSSNEE